MSEAGSGPAEEPPEPADLRLPAAAAVAWLAALLTGAVGGMGLVVVTALCTAGGVVAVRPLLRRGRGDLVRSGVALAVVAAAVGCSVLVRHQAVVANPVAALAHEHAAARLTGVVATDPRPVVGRFGDETVVRVTVTEVVARGVSVTLRAPVLVVGGPSWSHVRLGSTLAWTGLLAPADGSGGSGGSGGSDSDVSALSVGPGPPTVLSPPGWAWRAAGAVRSAIRDSVAGRPADQQALVPGLVDGDDGGLDPGLVADFRTTGLTHLTAVSGTNLTLLVGFLLVLARWLGVRGRWLRLVAALGIVGFVLIARTEPSVVRAATMGTIALVGLGVDGRRRATRGLALAVVVLLLVQPALATSPGFALSALATAGIVLLAPGWRDALARWLPRPVAEAIAVPAAAQLACTPVVAALSGQVSLVAVLANLLAEPAVGPATVLGLAGGLLDLVWPPAGRVVGVVAGACVAWIATVARRTAGLPVPAIGWGTGAVALGLLTFVCLAVALGLPWLLRRRRRALPAAGLLVVALLVRLPHPGWPGTWAMAMCDVGQGDGLALHAGPGAAVVVDAGPDPVLMKRCLDDLGVHQVPLVVLTHFHADHVDGLSGVFAGRHVAELWVTRLQDPPTGVSEVDQVAGAHGVTPRLPAFGAAVRYGEVTLQVLYPDAGPPEPGPGDGSTANNASIVLLVEVDGVRLLLTGDIEPPGQEQLARELPGLRVDVLKVPHHGSRYQDLPWLASLGARDALISVGADNDYGHPAASTVEALEGDGLAVFRTDQNGTLLVAPGPATGSAPVVRPQHGTASRQPAT